MLYHWYYRQLRQTTNFQGNSQLSIYLHLNFVWQISNSINITRNITHSGNLIYRVATNSSKKDILQFACVIWMVSFYTTTWCDGNYITWSSSVIADGPEKMMIEPKHDLSIHWHRTRSPSIMRWTKNSM